MFVVVLNPTAANTATALVELSPDNVTYTQVGKQEMPAGSGITTGSFLHTFTVYVPAGWYIKCTMTNGSIGGSFGRFW